jgi:imidazoleglycerol phosphate dehydratase HisB
VCTWINSHHIWIFILELQGLNNYHTKDLPLSAVADLRDDDHAQVRDVEKALYAAIDEAWKEY